MPQLRPSTLVRSLLVLGLLLASANAYAQFPMQLGHPDQGTKPEDIREIVSRFCRLDYEGARLDPQGWQKLQPLVWWKSNPDFTAVAVISRYTVSPSPGLTHGKYTVTVHYYETGRFDPALGYIRELSNDDVDYTVSAVGDEWRVYDASPNVPHVSAVALAKWLNAKTAAAPDDASKKIYQDALRQLQTPAAPGPSK